MGLTQTGTDGIKDDAITLAKQAAGTDGQIITYDASGNPVAVGPGTDGQVLTSTGAGSPPAFEDIPAKAALTGSTNNTITTVTGANAIQGEANLTFDGSDFAVTGNTTLTGAAGSDALTVQLTNDNAEGVTVTGGSSQGRTNLSLKAGNATSGSITALRLKNSSGTSIGSFQMDNSTDDIDILNSSQGGNIFFHTNESGSSLKKVTIQDDGHLKIHNGDLVIGTNGHGIDFSASESSNTTASSVLADYEEGTWVPTTNANLTLNTSYDTFGYVKVGKMVTIRGYFVASAVSGTNTIELSLPFTVSEWTERANYGGSGTMFKYVSGDYGTVAVYTPEGSSTMRFYRCQGDNSVWAGLNNSNISTDSGIYFTHTYFHG